MGITKYVFGGVTNERKHLKPRMDYMNGFSCPLDLTNYTKHFHVIYEWGTMSFYWEICCYLFILMTFFFIVNHTKNMKNTWGNQEKFLHSISLKIQQLQCLPFFVTILLEVCKSLYIHITMDIS